MLGYLPQSFGAYPELTVVEFLEYVATLRGLDDETASARIEAQLELTNLGDVRDERIGTSPGGCAVGSGLHRRSSTTQIC